MPDQSTTAYNAALINSAGQVASTGVQAMATAKLNRKTMKYNDEWAYRQREWALQDRDYQTEYNSPVNQRKRMIAAGMNPALMYGGSVQQGNSQQPRQTPSPQANLQAPDLSGIGRATSTSLSTYYDIKMQEAQLARMQKQNELLDAQVQKENSVTQLNWDKSRFTESQNEKLRGWLDALKSFDARSSGEVKTDEQGNITIESTPTYYHSQMQDAVSSLNYKFDENQRREIYTAANAEQITARISLMAQQQATSSAQAEQIKANTDLLMKSGILKQMDIDGYKLLDSGNKVANTLISLLKIIFK